jgi:hypothetical protein
VNSLGLCSLWGDASGVVVGVIEARRVADELGVKLGAGPMVFVDEGVGKSVSSGDAEGTGDSVGLGGAGSSRLEAA